MILTRGPTSDIACNRTCLPHTTCSCPCCHHSFSSWFIFVYISSSPTMSTPIYLYFTPVSDTTYITTSTVGFHAAIPSIYFRTYPDNSYHTIPPRICISQPCIPHLHNPIAFFFALTLLIATSVQIITSPSFVRNSVVCLIVSRCSTICLSFCSYSYQS